MNLHIQYTSVCLVDLKRNDLNIFNSVFGISSMNGSIIFFPQIFKMCVYAVENVNSMKTIQIYLPIQLIIGSKNSVLNSTKVPKLPQTKITPSLHN